jgi:hypothetical protein
MADKEKNVNGTNGEGTPEGNQNPAATTEVTEMKQKGGIGTTIKVVAGLALVAAGTGLGWFLKGIFGGRDDDSESEAAEAEHPEE